MSYEHHLKADELLDTKWEAAKLHCKRNCAVELCQFCGDETIMHTCLDEVGDQVDEEEHQKSGAYGADQEPYCWDCYWERS